MSDKSKNIFSKNANLYFGSLILVSNLPLISNWTLYLVTNDVYRFGIVGSFWFQLLWGVFFYSLLLVISYDIKPKLFLTIVAIVFLVFQPINLLGSLYKTSYYYNTSKCSDFEIIQKDDLFIDSNSKYNPNRIYIYQFSKQLQKEIEFEYPNEGAPSGGPSSIKFNLSNLESYEKNRFLECYISKQELIIKS